MPKRDAAPIGAPTWNDLFTSDPDRSEAFYTALFGWKVDDPGEQYGGYKNFTKDDIPVAGFMRNDGEFGAANLVDSGPGTLAPDAWSIYLATDDAKRTTDAAVARGGEVVYGPMEVASLGTQGMVTDPGGAAIGLWQPNEVQGFGILNEPNTPSWFELHTRSYDASVQFYRDVFKWDTFTAADEPGFRYTTLGKEENGLAGIMDASAFLPEGVPSHWSVYFQVDDAAAAIAKVKDLGGSVITDAEQTPYGWLATVADPTGAVFKLQQP